MVKCTKEHMEAKLNTTLYPNMEPEDFHLYNSTCRYSSATSTHVIFIVPLDSCGTTHNTSASHISYSNSINWIRKSGTRNRVISRDMILSIPFRCTYIRKGILSVVSFSPRRKIVITSEGKVLSFFSFAMRVSIACMCERDRLGGHTRFHNHR